MYILGVHDYISVPVQVKSVETELNKYNKMPQLHIIATLDLSPNGENPDIVLWAPVDATETITVDDDFVSRDIVLEATCSGDHANPYNDPKPGIRAIWFGAPKSPDAQLALVMSEAPK